MCDFRGRGRIEALVQGVKSATGVRHRSNFVRERVAEACPRNIVEDFFMLLLIPPSLSPISFHTIRIGSDRYLWKLYVFLHERNHRHVTSILIPMNLGYLL